MASREDDARRAYRRALLLARDRGYQLNRTGVERLYRAFAELIRRIAIEDGTEAMSAERAERLRREVDTMLRLLQRDLARITEESVGRTLVDVVDLHRRATDEIFQQFGRRMVLAVGWDAIPARAFASMLARPGAVTFETLFRRKILALAPEIDTFLDAAVARGVSAGRGAKDLAGILARDDPRLIRLLQRADVDISDLHRGAGTIDYSVYGMDEADAKALRGLLYDARRITVSETNNALRAANDAAAAESPLVEATAWQRSGRHFRPDVCDMLAETDAFGYGPGFYPAGKFPVAPHPHCACTMGAVKFRRPGEWDQPKAAPRPLGIDPADEQYTARWSEQWTENERARYQREYAAILREQESSRREAA